ncbi:MAG TPA: hypothetical protein DCE14_04165 [Kosmotogaceae bacterium]|nr:MAG: Uncharacterized protein XE05_1106 [Thermotogales bacterium 46_20]HAA85531.1 hypothetical protein [Kosmotogaceae bacterium]
MRRGLSLVEMCIGLLVGSIVTASLLSLFTQFTMITGRFLSENKHLLALFRAFNMIERDLESYLRLSAPVTENALSFDVRTGNTTERVTYFVRDGTKLMRRVNTGTNTVFESTKPIIFESDGKVFIIRIGDYSVIYPIIRE